MPGIAVRLQSYPALGQATPLRDGGSTAITVVLEVPASLASEPWEVSLWHSLNEGEWTETSLDPCDDTTLCSLRSLSEDVSRFYFRGNLSITSFVQFTFKFRHNKNVDWKWVKDEHGLGDGFIIASSPTLPQHGFGKVVGGLDDLWTVADCISQSPRTRLWSLEATVPAAKGETPSSRDLEIGIPWGSFKRWFALVRLWTPWLAPRQGKDSFFLDKDAILCSFLSHRGQHLVFLAMSGINNVIAAFRHTQNGGVLVHAQNDGDNVERVVILAAAGTEFENTVAAAMYHARTLVSASQDANAALTQDVTKLAGEVRPKWMEGWYDGLGFCTWNALGQQLTEEKVMEAVDTLSKNDIYVSSLIIDDNWQSIDYRGDGQFQYGWTDFEAEPKAFPHGLKKAVSRIREKHPTIQHIAVWHALLGYWGGISPQGKIAETYKTTEVIRKEDERRKLPLGGPMTVVAKEDVARLYDDFYRFLADAGIDAVKTDSQFMIDMWASAVTRRNLINTYLDAWTLAALRHFSLRVISCMSQFPQALFHSMMPQNRPTFLARNSDDFFPEIPESHPWHVWANAHNSIFMRHLNVLPDWDMFQTVHDYSGFHAAARCVSGGPIYITDVPGEHNMALIRQMTGRTPRGKTVIFRPSVLGRSMNPYAAYDDDLLLKIGAYHGRSDLGTPILGVFNVSSRLLAELIPLSLFPGTMESRRYVVRSHNSGRVSAPMAPHTETPPLITVSLGIRGHDILCAFPLTALDGPRYGNMYVANLGLSDKMTGCAAIVTSSIKKRENGRAVLDTRLKALGVLGIYISALPRMSIEGDFMITIQEQPIPVHTVCVSPRDECVLEVDTEKAWDEMGLDSQWSNEVEAKVYFSP